MMFRNACLRSASSAMTVAGPLWKLTKTCTWCARAWAEISPSRSERTLWASRGTKVRLTGRAKLRKLVTTSFSRSTSFRMIA
jgi:hypothetical protein